jgi:DNA-binding NarL/FixJ family response regulator
MSGHSKSVLVADDGTLIRQKLCEMLRREGGYNICAEAENGKDAVEKAQQLRPDLIIMNFSMPVMNGVEAARELKKSMPSVPIIIFSNYIDSFVRKLALSIGVSAVISKSEHLSVLLKTAHSVLLHSAA